MKFKTGDTFYLKGTKQRYFIADHDMGGNYYLCALKDKRYAYLSYMLKRISEEALIEKYTLIKED